MIYKLKKIYPTLPQDWKVGMEVVKGPFSYLPKDSSYRPHHVYFYDVENSSQYWEKVSEVIYEIIELKNTGNSILNNSNFDKRYSSLTHLLQSSLIKGNEFYNSFILYKVMRMSDGEIFTIGDRVSLRNETTVYTIISMQITDKNNIYVSARTIDNSGFGQTLDKLIVRKPLFITEDDVNIFEADTYWILGGNGRVILKEDVKITKQLCRIGSGQLHQTKDHLNKDCHFITFSTKEKAEEYILLNKPCLSVKDVMEAGYGICNPKSLIDIVKSKL